MINKIAALGVLALALWGCGGGSSADMVRAGRPGKTVASVEAPGWMFLEERVHDGASLTLLRGQRWSFVTLQAQKYSTSGQFTSDRRRDSAHGAAAILVSHGSVRLGTRHS